MKSPAVAPRTRSRAPALALFCAPIVVLAVAAVALRPIATARTWWVLGVGLVVLLLLIATGPLRRGKTDGSDAAARRVFLRALFATAMLFAACCAWIASQSFDGVLGVWPGIIFVPGWLLFAVLIPLWVDSPVIRTSEPATGWKMLGPLKLLYSNPDDDALWVHLPPQWAGDTLSMMYTPNLGNPWGRAAMTAFVLLLIAMLALVVANAVAT